MRTRVRTRVLSTSGASTPGSPCLVLVISVMVKVYIMHMVITIRYFNITWNTRLMLGYICLFDVLYLGFLVLYFYCI